MRGRRADLEELGAAVEREQQATRSGRSRAELTVDVADVGAAHDRDVDARRAEGSTSSRTARASASRSGTAVPSQSNTIASNRRASKGGKVGTVDAEFPGKPRDVMTATVAVTRRGRRSSERTLTRGHRPTARGSA